MTKQDKAAMTKRYFVHQLGMTFILVYNDGTSIFNGKLYSSYKSARRALTRYYGFAYEQKL